MGLEVLDRGLHADLEGSDQLFRRDGGIEEAPAGPLSLVDIGSRGPGDRLLNSYPGISLGT